MKKIIIITILFAAFSILTVPAYADSCDDLAQSYQPMIDRQTVTTQNELARRGISTTEGLGLTELNNALQPIIAQMNLAISECKLEQARTSAGLNSQTNNPPPNTPAPNNYYIYIAATPTPQPTPTPRVFQIIVTATPFPTPIASVYPTLRPTRVMYNKPTPEASPTATPSSTPTPTPIMNPNKQKYNLFQNITNLFTNIYRWLVH